MRFRRAVATILDVAYVLLPIGAGASFAASFWLLFGAFLVATVSVVMTRNVLVSPRIARALPEAYGILKGALSFAAFDSDADVRITLFVPDHSRRGLRQTLPYASTSEDARYGSHRRLSVTKGIVGKCFRTGDICHGTVDGTNTVNDLVANWGFTREEASQLRQDRRSYLALPVKDYLGEIAAIIYLDSNRIDTFSAENAVALARVCPPLSRYLRPRR